MEAIDQVMSRIADLVELHSVPAEEVDMLLSSARDYLKQGYSVDDIVRILRSTEHLNPDLPEDVALARMAKIHEKYQGKK